MNEDHTIRCRIRGRKVILDSGLEGDCWFQAWKNRKMVKEYGEDAVTFEKALLAGIGLAGSARISINAVQRGCSRLLGNRVDLRDNVMERKTLLAMPGVAPRTGKVGCDSYEGAGQARIFFWSYP